MNYYKSLKLDIEPFSNSPDPELFFPSKQHAQALQWLEIGIRLKRGLHVLIGDIGTGKTTICRKLLQGLAPDESVKAMLILDPGFSSAKSFLQELHFLFTGRHPHPDRDPRDLKEILKSVLFKRTIDRNELLVLVIDEGQKLSEEMLEVLRELLNYETNKEKLLQIIIFGQKELTETLNCVPNLKDRINKLLVITPLTKEETAEFIQFRLRRAATGPEYPHFSKRALSTIFRVTKGYPRRIVTLCHHVILRLTTAQTTNATTRLVKSVLRENSFGSSGREWLQYLQLTTAAVLLACAVYIVAVPRTNFLAPLRSLLLTEEIQDHISYEPKGTTAAVNRTTELIERKFSEFLENSSSFLASLTSKTPSSALTSQPIVSDEISTGTQQRAVPPNVLGAVQLAEGYTLNKLLTDVYGEYSTHLLHEVLRMNPQISHSSVISSSTPVLLPALNMHPVSNENPKYWLEIGRERDLSQAILNVTNINKFYATFRILPVWNAESGLYFPIILRTIFSNREEAEKILQMLPHSMQNEITIVESPLIDTLYCGKI